MRWHHRDVASRGRISGEREAVQGSGQCDFRSLTSGFAAPRPGAGGRLGRPQGWRSVVGGWSAGACDSCSCSPPARSRGVRGGGGEGNVGEGPGRVSAGFWPGLKASFQARSRGRCQAARLAGEGRHVAAAGPCLLGGAVNRVARAISARGFGFAVCCLHRCYCCCPSLKRSEGRHPLGFACKRLGQMGLQDPAELSGPAGWVPSQLRPFRPPNTLLLLLHPPHFPSTAEGERGVVLTPREGSQAAGAWEAQAQVWGRELTGLFWPDLPGQATSSYVSSKRRLCVCEHF